MKKISFTRFCQLAGVVGLFATALFTSCAPRAASEKKDSLAADSPFDTLANFCNWSELGLREGADEKSKYLTTIYLGERFSLLGDTGSAVIQGHRLHYHKIKLTDGKEGWARDEFIALEAMPAVFLKTTEICVRPDDASVSDKTFSALDFVSARPATNGWVEVVGKPQADTWFQKGYVRPAALTFKKSDAELAALYRRAMETKDPSAKQTRLDHLKDPQFQSSQLYNFIFPVAGKTDSAGATDVTYDFDGDATANGRDPWKTNNISYVKGRNGADNTAVSFDGTSSYLNKSIGDDRVNVSYCFWIKAHEVNKAATVMMVGNGCTSGYGLTTDDDGNGGMRLVVLCGGIQGNITNSDYSLPINEWVHIALVKQGNTFLLYINGALSSTGISAHNSLDGNFSLGAGMGCHPAAFGGFFGCDIDELYINNSALTPAQIQNVMDAAD